jgi:parallel beta-helix repeat protein
MNNTLTGNKTGLLIFHSIDMNVLTGNKIPLLSAVV